MIRCGTCGGNHRNADTVRKCSEDYRKYGFRGNPRATRNVAKAEKSYDAWATDPVRRGSDYLDYITDETVAAALEEATPNGYYFIPRDSWKPNGMAVRARRFKTGRWKGVWFITEVEGFATGSPDLVTGSVSDRQYIIEKIVQAGPRTCMAQYGRVSGRCGICDEALTEEERETTGGHAECFQESFEKQPAA